MVPNSVIIQEITIAGKITRLLCPKWATSFLNVLEMSEVLKSESQETTKLQRLIRIKNLKIYTMQCDVTESQDWLLNPRDKTHIYFLSLIDCFDS